MNDEKKSHHVAWADRVGYHKILYQDIFACSATYGTELYPQAVWRLYNDILNIKGDGPKLKDEVNKYLETEWYPKRDETLSKSEAADSGDQSVINEELERIERIMLPDLCYFIKQLLEDYGFGTYKGEYGGEYDTWS